MDQLSLFDYVNNKGDNKESTIETISNTSRSSKGSKKIKVLSLFSGCGGMDIGFEGGFTCLKRSINTDIHPNWISEDFGEWVRVVDTSFETVFANDIRPDAKAAWVSYFKRKYKNPDDIYHLESIVDLVKRAKEGEKVFPDNIDIVTGGFPCQDFSIAGKRLGFNSHKSHNGEKLEVDEPSIENRGQLYMWMREVVTLTKPLMFVAENVKGLTNLDDVKEVIERDFSNAGDGGYLVLPARVLHSADYGVPQSRERVIFYGFKKSALKSKALEELTQNIISKEYDPSNSMYIEDLKFVYNYKNKSQENKKYRAFDLSKPCKIEVRNLYFRYPNANEYALYNISFTIMPGEKVSIVGLNGSGKTTLIKLLLRFYEPEQGEIFINDINIKEYNKEDLQKNIGVVFQDHHVYAYTTKENIAFEEKIIENTYDVLV